MIDLPSQLKKLLSRVKKAFTAVFMYLKHRSRIREGLLLFVLGMSIFGYILFVPPAGFPVGRVVRVEEGMTLVQVSNLLQKENVIRSRILFEFSVVLIAGDKNIIAGDYYFSNPLSVFGVAKRLSSGEYGLTPKKILIPEGATIADMAKLYSARFPKITEEEFLDAATGKEGYLFPDTYLFLPNVQADQVVKEMEKNFKTKIASIQDVIDGSERSLSDIVIMASIIEKEARKYKTKEIISGILWRRIDIGMPLQVDAAFLYINGKSTYDLTLTDLATDSPYNTYKYKGLPVGPISNPGLDSIKAAAQPKETSYLYYLSDRSGVMHYSDDFEQHKANKRLYLN